MQAAAFAWGLRFPGGIRFDEAVAGLDRAVSAVSARFVLAVVIAAGGLLLWDFFLRRKMGRGWRKPPFVPGDSAGRGSATGLVRLSGFGQQRGDRRPSACFLHAGYPASADFADSPGAGRGNDCRRGRCSGDRGFSADSGRNGSAGLAGVQRNAGGRGYDALLNVTLFTGQG